MQAGDDASWNEWEGKDSKFQGMRKADATKHGIVRTIVPGGSIREATFYEDKLHGLCFIWGNNTYGAFEALIYDHGKIKARICWRDDWLERYSSGDKELILENNGLSIFKP